MSRPRQSLSSPLFFCRAGNGSRSVDCGVPKMAAISAFFFSKQGCRQGADDLDGLHLIGPSVTSNKGCRPTRGLGHACRTAQSACSPHG